MGQRCRIPESCPRKRFLSRAKSRLSLRIKRKELLKKIEGRVAASPGPITREGFLKGVNYTSWKPDELSEDMSEFQPDISVRNWVSRI